MSSLPTERRRLRRATRDEQGIAMVTAILASTVVLSLSLVAVSLAAHSGSAGLLDRLRVQTVHAAEAGLDRTLSTIQATVPAQLCTIPTTETFTGRTTTQSTGTVKWYDAGGTERPCTYFSNSVLPASALVTTKGTVPRSATGVRRGTQAQVNLRPRYGAYDTAIFSDASPSFANNLSLRRGATDANIYTNGSVACSNSFDAQGSIRAQGAVSLANSCTVGVDLWANGAVTMSNSATVGHDVTSSTSSIALSNSAKILGRARAGTSCTGCGPSAVTTQPPTVNSPQASPPVQTFPALPYTAASWTAQGWTEKLYTGASACTSAKTFLTSNTSSTKYVVRIAANCALSFSNNTNIAVNGDLAIVSDGPISTTNKTDFTGGSGIAKTLYLVVPWAGIPAASPCSASPRPDISMSNNTGFSNINFLVYSPCTVNFSNNNSSTGGSVYGGTVNIANLFTMTFVATIVPGAGVVTGFEMDIVYTREVTV